VIHGDEPESIGGTNEGPSPFVLLGMALASCTITTIWRVARDKGIELSGVEVDVAHKQNRFDETAESSYLVTCDLRMTAIRRRIVVKGRLSDEDVEALLWGAEHCPVSNTLMSGIPLKTEIKAAAPSEA
jgi:putative redox protein